LSIDARHIKLVNQIKILLRLDAASVFVAPLALVALFPLPSLLASAALFALSAWRTVSIFFAALSAVCSLLLHHRSL
jgi:hypothetical protein